MSVTHLHTEDDVAELLGITAEDVRRACREKGWPHVRPKRSVWRFTDGHVEQIVAMSSTSPDRSSRGSGLTKRSAAHAGRRSA